VKEEASKTKKNFFTRLMSMDDATWKRHANPLSVWSRVVTGLPVLLFAVWNLKPIDGWSLAIVAIAFVWIWLNPRLFPPPDNTDNWASKVTFGERVWLNRSSRPIPSHHRRWALFLSIVAGVGFLIAIVGAYLKMPLPAISGGFVSWLGKMWFCDRMVWLYEDMKDIPEYSSWIRK
jgi:hypothetical protein